MPPKRPPVRTKSDKAGPVRLTFNAAGDRLGLTRQAIGQWAAKPGAPVVSEGGTTLILWPDFARWREKELVDKAVRDTSPTVTLDEARTRKALAEAELAELEVAKARGEFVSVADAGEAWGRALDLVIARLRTLGPSLVRFGPEVELAAEAEAERIVQELHDVNSDVISEPAEEAKEAA